MRLAEAHLLLTRGEGPIGLLGGQNRLAPQIANCACSEEKIDLFSAKIDQRGEAHLLFKRGATIRARLEGRRWGQGGTGQFRLITPPPLWTLKYGYAKGPMVDKRGSAVSYQRGNPTTLNIMLRICTLKTKP